MLSLLVYWLSGPCSTPAFFHSARKHRSNSCSSASWYRVMVLKKLGGELLEE